MTGFSEAARSHDLRAASRTERRRLDLLADVIRRDPSEPTYREVLEEYKRRVTYSGTPKSMRHLKSYTALMVGHPLTPPV